jgi:RHS repeat-associated protein
MMIAAAKAGTPWQSTVPISHTVVAKVVESNNLPVAGRPADTFETDYTYRDAVWDGQQREFRGYRQVWTRRTGDADTPSSTTWTAFLTGDCADETADSVDDCSPAGRWHENPREALKGLEVASETYDDSGVYLSTKHKTYTLRQLYTGADGRVVRHAFASATDAWMYDTYGFVAAPTALSVADVTLDGAAGPVPASGLTLRGAAGRAHLQTAKAVDAFGDVTADTNLGCVDGCAQVDEAVTHNAQYAVAPGDASAWLYRPVHTWVSGSQTPARKEELLTYDDRGHERVKRAMLSGTAALMRFHEPAAGASTDAGAPEVAPAPAAASSDGTIVVSAEDYDGFGNKTFLRGANNRCRTIAYDQAYASLAVTESIYVGALGPDQGGSGSVASAAFAAATGGSACGATTLSAISAYDRGLEKPTLVTDLHGETTVVAYDGLGRLSAFYRPDPSTLGLAEPNASYQVTYDVDPTGARPYSLMHTISLAGASTGSAAVGAREAWGYIDGLGRTVLTMAQADPAAGDQGAWVVQGLTQYDSKGNARASFLPWFSNAAPNAYPLADPPATASTQHVYDAFQREYRTIDTAGGVSQEVHFHALSTDLWDAADLNPAGAHYGTYATKAKDGLGRDVSLIERIRLNGAIAANETRTDYLPTGEASRITRTGGAAGRIVRWMVHDTLGRMVVNAEPDTTKGFSQASPGTSATVPLVYAYDDAGDLVGTSDARGCGHNRFFDAGGREVAQDYSPCLNTQPAYTAPNLATGDGTEAYTLYDAPEPDASADCPQDPALLAGNVSSISDRGSRVVKAYDARGHVTCESRRIARPGDSPPSLAARYASNWFSRSAAFDEADRPMRQTTGATAPELLAADGTSAITTSYTARGMVAVAGSSYGPLVGAVVRDAGGLIQSIQYADAAGTSTLFTYDARLRVQTVLTSRAAPAPLPPSFQAVLEDVAFGYDEVGDPIAIQDRRDPSAWPAGAQPVSRAIAYDDLYRAIDVVYQYPTSGGDAWVDPFDAENRGVDADPRRAMPAPRVSFPQRVLHQTFAYDALGNEIDAEDDARGFYDRSLGAVTNGAAGPYQLASASNELGQSPSEGHLSAAYDDAGNLVSLTVARGGACSPQGAACSHVFAYEWDEVGDLTRARRWDVAGDPGVPGAPPAAAPNAELRYAYDAEGARVLKTAVDAASGEMVHAVYPMETLELRGAAFDGDAYARTAATEVPYLFAHGVRIARVAYALEGVPAGAGGNLRVYLSLLDHLGSTSFVVDRDTSELVEATTYTPYGATESDYRPGRWASFREDHRFTGKEEDVQVGLAYFGKRYLAPALHRWISADPLAVQSPGKGDPNVYAYVHGAVFKAVDPHGLDAKPIIRTNEFTNTITIQADFAFSGKGATPALIERLGKAMMAQWNQNGWTYTDPKFGKTYSVKFDIRTMSALDGIKQMQQDGGKRIVNFITINPKVDPSYVQNYRTGEWNGHSWVTCHEAGHCMTLDDRYIEAGTPGHRMTKPDTGWEHNIMAVFNGKVDQRNIDALAGTAVARMNAFNAAHPPDPLGLVPEARGLPPMPQRFETILNEANPVNEQPRTPAPLPAPAATSGP